jgi:hypothetical protein
MKNLSSALTAVLALTAPLAIAQTALNAPKFVPFNDFVEHTRSASMSEFAALPGSKVKDAAAFEEMRQAIVDRYQGVPITHSFMVGQLHYDCVPIDKQPALRTYGLKEIAPAPPQELAGKAAAQKGNIKPAQLAPMVDEAGNSASCEANTTPMLRTTLEMMSRFPTLNDFYHKAPPSSTRNAQAQATGASAEGQLGSATGLNNSSFVPPNSNGHAYSYTYQYVNNRGGNSNINIWAPYVWTAVGEVFSLSQEWYIGGSGAGLQTEEVGWVVYPAMFGDERSHFFIYSTSGNYAKGTGCWNNSCGDFVQVADFGLLGNYFSTVSTYGGTQYDFSATYYLYQGNWWLNFQGTWVGYYPGYKYHGGQNAYYAQLIEFGSEGVASYYWPPEGSGQWPWTGWSHAAYQRNLYYIAPTTAYASYWDTLNAVNPSPSCYRISGPYSSSSPGWARYFYEGGPGGYGC